MQGKYYNTKSGALSKKEKQDVQAGLIQQIDQQHNYASVKAFLDNCREKNREYQGSGAYGIPYWRLIPYLEGMIRQSLKEK